MNKLLGGSLVATAAAGATMPVSSWMDALPLIISALLQGLGMFFEFRKGN